MEVGEIYNLVFGVGVGGDCKGLFVGNDFEIENN